MAVNEQSDIPVHGKPALFLQEGLLWKTGQPRPVTQQQYRAHQL